MKKYGKLTESQFSQVLNELLPAFDEAVSELTVLMANTSDPKCSDILKRRFHWSWVYEMPFVTHIAIVTIGLGLDDWVKDLAKHADPQHSILNGGDALMPDDLPADVEIEDVIGALMSIVRTMQCVMKHGRSLSALLQDARELGNAESLFKAIKIDRSVLSCPTAADFIAKAELTGNSDFFKKLAAACRGPSKKEWEGLEQMRLAFNVLMENELRDMSEADLEHLMVNVLGAYKPVPGARKNLAEQYRKFKAFKTI